MNKHHIVYGELNHTLTRLILTLISNHTTERVSVVAPKDRDEKIFNGNIALYLNEVATKNHILLTKKQMEKVTVYNKDISIGTNDPLSKIEQQLASLGIYHHETISWEVGGNDAAAAEFGSASYTTIRRHSCDDINSASSEKPFSDSAESESNGRTVQSLDVLNICGPVGYYRDVVDSPLNQLIFNLINFPKRFRNEKLRLHLPSTLYLSFALYEDYIEAIDNFTDAKISHDTTIRSKYKISARELVSTIASVLGIDLDILNSKVTDKSPAEIALADVLERSPLVMLTQDEAQNLDSDSESFLSDLANETLRAKEWNKDKTVSSTLFANEKNHASYLNFADRITQISKSISRDKIAILHERGDLAYGSFEYSIQSCVSNIAKLGIKPGTRIGIVSNDSPSFTIAVLSLMFSGSTAIIINPLLKATTIAQAMESAGVNTVLGDKDFLELVANNTDIPADLIKQAADIDIVAAIKTQGDDSELINWVPAQTRPFDYAIGMFTSGTTGAPRLIMRRHQDFIVSAERYAAQVLNLNTSDRAFSVSRMSFAFGLHNCFNALFNGATAILSPANLSINDIVDKIKLYKPTIFYAVPTVYQFLMNHEEVNTEAFRTIRCFVSAGDRMPTELNKKWKTKFNATIMDSLGSTEAFSTYLTNIPGTNRALGDTGKIVPGFDAKIVNEKGLICSHGEIGTLWLKGPTLPSRYENNAEATAERFKNGWYCTNDMFLRDKDGYFRYFGRADDVIKVSGQWVSPQDIEDMLMAHPDVLEIAVNAVGDSETTTRTNAFVVTERQDHDQLTKELKVYAKEHLERWKYPHTFQYVNILPKTVTGKLQRYRLENIASNIK